MVPIQEKQLIATTKVPLEVGKEEVKWHFTSFLSEFSENGAVEKQISCVSSPPSAIPRTQLPTQLRGAGNNCLKPISKKLIHQFLQQMLLLTTNNYKNSITA